MAWTLENRFKCQRYRLTADGWVTAGGAELRRGSYGWGRSLRGDPYFANVDVTDADDRVGYVLTLYVARALGFTDPGELVSAALDDKPHQ